MKPVVLAPAGPGDRPRDPCRILAAEVRGDQLELQVAYSGGSRDHDFELLALVPEGGIGPGEGTAEGAPEIPLLLTHDAHDDAARGMLTDTLVFDLSPLRELARATGAAFPHGAPGGGPLPLRLLDPRGRGEEYHLVADV